MILNFKTKHLAYIAAIIWTKITFPLQRQLYDQVSANPLPDDQCVIEITVDELVTAYRLVSFRPEGEAADINNEINAELVPQLVAAAAMTPQDIEALFIARATAIETATPENPAKLDPLSDPLDALEKLSLIDRGYKLSTAQIIANGMALLTA